MVCLPTDADAVQKTPCHLPWRGNVVLLGDPASLLAGEQRLVPNAERGGLHTPLLLARGARFLPLEGAGSSSLWPWDMTEARMTRLERKLGATTPIQTAQHLLWGVKVSGSPEPIAEEGASSSP